jgi:hypothetical protein
VPMRKYSTRSESDQQLGPARRPVTGSMVMPMMPGGRGQSGGAGLRW